jgi:hypothetical protein
MRCAKFPVSEASLSHMQNNHCLRREREPKLRRLAVSEPIATWHNFDVLPLSPRNRYPWAPPSSIKPDEWLKLRAERDETSVLCLNDKAILEARRLQHQSGLWPKVKRVDGRRLVPQSGTHPTLGYHKTQSMLHQWMPSPLTGLVMQRMGVANLRAV